MTTVQAFSAEHLSNHLWAITNPEQTSRQCIIFKYLSM